ncbi:MAG: hypothetical protein HWE18_10035 [Gammaproteobacteria bacterium]|nr:hypothetical protein [Gammaproteobacteria bacterium]
MYIAGLSELLLLSALLFSAKQGAQQKRHPLIYVALGITFGAAVMGLLRYLELANTLEWHKELSFAGKHFAMASFLIALLWQTLTPRALPYGLVGLALIFTVINYLTPIGIISDAYIVILSLVLIFKVRQNMQALYMGIAGVILLLSTLVWGAIIQDESLRIGVFHLCLSSFYVLITLSSRHLNTKPI